MGEYQKRQWKNHHYLESSWQEWFQFLFFYRSYRNRLEVFGRAYSFDFHGDVAWKVTKGDKIGF